MKNLYPIIFLVFVWFSASADYMIIPVQKVFKELPIAPGCWCAPWQFIVSGSNGEKLTDAVFSVSGVPAQMVAKVMVFYPQKRGTYTLPIPYADDLLYFPNNWKSQNGTLTYSADKVIAKFNGVELPSEPGTEVNILLGVYFLKSLPDKRFTITLNSLKLGENNAEFSPLPINMTSNKTFPVFKATHAKVIHSNGAPALRVNVKADAKLAFPPTITLKYPDLGLKDIHGSSHYRALLNKTSDHDYEIVIPEFMLISDNNLPKEQKKITYTATPAPDAWQTRADNTGCDLYDNDARDHNVSKPGGLTWLLSESVSLVFDLKEKVVFGGVSLFLRDYPVSVKMSVSADADGPWVEAGSMEFNLFPQEKFGEPFSPALYHLYFDQLHRGQYLRLNFSAKTMLTITEIMIWGSRSKGKTLSPVNYTIYGTDFRGLSKEINRKVTK